MYQKIKQIYRKFFLKQKTEFLLLQQDILASQYLQPLSNSYLPWSQSAIHPSGLVAILNEITMNNRSTIVECGGGISTFYIGRLLKNRGGHLYTIESDKEWCNILIKQIEKEKFSDYVSVIHAPLADTILGISNQNQWYETNQIKEKLFNKKIELLIIDGPPAYRKEIQYSRYPAVPFFKDYLAKDYAIILDDINRDGEQLIVSKWEKILGIKFELRFQHGNIAIGRSRPSLTI
jgi:hypothetical protein